MDSSAPFGLEGKGNGQLKLSLAFWGCISAALNDVIFSGKEHLRTTILQQLH